MRLTTEGAEELLFRISARILASSEIAYLCAEYTGHNGKPVTPEGISAYILTCTLRQTSDDVYELVAPDGENVRFMILCSKPITEIMNEEMENTLSEVNFLYKKTLTLEN